LQLVRTLQQRGTVGRVGLPDRLAEGLLFGTKRVRGLDRRTAGLVGGDQLVDQLRVLATVVLGGADDVRVLAEEFEINHRYQPTARTRSPCRDLHSPGGPDARSFPRTGHNQRSRIESCPPIRTTSICPPPRSSRGRCPSTPSSARSWRSCAI